MERGESSGQTPQGREIQWPWQLRFRESRSEDYMSLIPPSAPRFEGRMDTLPFRHWIIQTNTWMQEVGMPPARRVAAAVYLLVGEALEYWNTIPAFYGSGAWEHFQDVMTQRYAYVDDESVWNRDVRHFAQRIGELIHHYTIRFFQEIVGRSPHIMTDWERRDIYIQGLLPSSIPPDAALYILTFEEVREVVGEYDMQRHVAYPPDVFQYPAAGHQFVPFIPQMLIPEPAPLDNPAGENGVQDMDLEDPEEEDQADEDPEEEDHEDEDPADGDSEEEDSEEEDPEEDDPEENPEEEEDPLGVVVDPDPIEQPGVAVPAFPFQNGWGHWDAPGANGIGDVVYGGAQGGVDD